MISLLSRSALTEQCLSAGQCELASSVMASLPLLLERLVFASASYPSLQRLAFSCGLTFKSVLKVMCNMGRAATESVDELWHRFVCLFACIDDLHHSSFVILFFFTATFAEHLSASLWSCACSPCLNLQLSCTQLQMRLCHPQPHCL